MIYLASPYSSPILGIQDQRHAAALDCALVLMKQGHHVFSPIVYGVAMAAAGNLPTDAGFWHNFNMQFLKHSEALFVLELSGWEQSAGVKVEINAAKILGMRVINIQPKPSAMEQQAVELIKGLKNGKNNSN